MSDKVIGTSRVLLQLSKKKIIESGHIHVCASPVRVSKWTLNTNNNEISFLSY